MRNETILAIQFFQEKHIILDAKIINLFISSDQGKCNIQITFEPIINDFKEKRVTITFIDVKKIALFDDEGAIVGRYVSRLSYLMVRTEIFIFHWIPMIVHKINLMMILE